MCSVQSKELHVTREVESSGRDCTSFPGCSVLRVLTTRLSSASYAALFRCVGRQLRAAAASANNELASLLYCFLNCPEAPSNKSRSQNYYSRLLPAQPAAVFRSFHAQQERWVQHRNSCFTHGRRFENTVLARDGHRRERRIRGSCLLCAA